MTAKFEIVTTHGAVVDIPLNRLKKSSKNVRKVAHTDADVEARAASIGAKGMIQPPVVEPEFGEEGQPTGYYLVTAGESRRLALCLRAKRKEIRKTEPVRCVIDTVNDPSEISLDENINRTDLHPADQFEAFKTLADEKGWGAEEIAARFGVTPHVVRQRMRLGAVSPKLIGLYRQDELTLDQLMAFGVTDDHARQEQVFETLSPFQRGAHVIRRAMTEAKVHADDRRARFIGFEAYDAAGGAILRDLFVEDYGGWFEDVALLDRMVAEKLEDLGEQVRAEGWKWVEVHTDFPHSHALRRVYARRVERSPEETAQIGALTEEYDGLVEQWAEVEDLPPEIDTRLKEIDAVLDAFGDAEAYDPDDVSRGGAYVYLGHDGEACIERGFIRPEDERAAPEPEAESGEVIADGEGVVSDEGEATDEEEPDGLTPLSDRLVLDLTAYRTAGLREALGRQPEVALVAVIHAFALRAFYPLSAQPTCLEVKTVSAGLGVHAFGLDDSLAGRAVSERHADWAKRLPDGAGELWAYLNALGGGELLDLLAHCASLTVNALRMPWERKPAVWGHADVLASAVSLDMTTTWAPTRDAYLDRVTKARIAEAVREGVSPEAAERLDGLKKAEMAEAAEQLLKPTGWLPPLLRTAPRDLSEPEDPDGDGDAAGDATPKEAAAEQSFAAE
ncbi:MAG: ParB/RepB/Spo0J family partition protein [Parcubacteria group bacterium]